MMAMPSRPRLAALSVFLTALADGGVIAQQKPPIPTTERPPGSIVDFVAVTASGSPVIDLTAAEVEVRLNGRLRPIQLLRLMRVAGDTPAAAVPAAVPPPYGANARTSSSTERRIILAIDNDSFRPGTEGPMREAIGGLITRLSPRDSLLLVTMPYSGVIVPFTRDHGRIRAALAGLTGQRSQNESGSDMACRTRRVLETLEGFLNRAGAGDTPTTVVFLTAGMAGPRRDAPAPRAPGMCELEPRTFENVGKAAAAARASFYVLHPGDLPRSTLALGPGPLGSDNPIEGIEHLAGVTGGQRITLRAVGTDALTQVALETAAYYVAEVEANRQDREGELQRLNVRVTRPGVVVRARPSIAFLPPPPLVTKPSTPTVHQLLMVAEEFAELPMRISGFAMRGQDGRIKIVGVAETADPGAVLATAAMALVDSAGRVVGQATASDAAEIPLATAMLVAPGTYRLRVAATDTTGRYGTADVQVLAELTPVGPLQLSALSLGLSRAGALVPRLQFGTESIALASFEIYGAPQQGMRLAAVLEVARTADGPALVTNRLAIERGEGDRLVATGVVPIGALPAGDYVVRGVIGIEGGATGRVMRTLRKK